MSSAGGDAPAVVLDALESLGLAPGLPVHGAPGRLEDLVLRFSARVPFRLGAGDASAEELLSRFLEDGSGGGPSSRTRALLALARAAGFDAAPVAAEAEGAARPILLLGVGTVRALFDAGHPVPVLLPLDGFPKDGVSTALGRLSLETPAAGEALLLAEARGSRRELWRTALAPLAEEAFPADLLGAPGLVRLLDDRLLRWAAGRMEVSDGWSLLSFPFAPGAATLGELFAQPVEDDVAAVPAGDGPALLEVGEWTGEPPERVGARLATPEGLAGLLPEGLRAVEVEAGAGGWSWRIETVEGEAVRSERVETAPGEGRVEVTLAGGTWPFSRRVYRALADDGGTRLAALAELAEPVPARGLPEGTRKALVFHLAAELLALALASAGG